MKPQDPDASPAGGPETRMGTGAEAGSPRSACGTETAAKPEPGSAGPEPGDAALRWVPAAGPRPTAAADP